MESIIHADIKHDLYISLLKKGYSVEKEKKLSRTSRPDLTLILNKKLIAIEIQNSCISPFKILAKMKSHTLAGAYTLWLISPQIACKFLRRKKWCELIQKLSNGHIFIATSSLEIIPARIDYLYGSTNKFINYYENPVEIDELFFECNDLGLNVMSWENWWIEEYLEFFDLYNYNF